MRNALLIAMAFCFALLPLSAQAESKEQQRAEIRTTAKSVLNRLYKAQPAARGAVAGAAGYGVFSNFGMKIFFAGGGSGHGMVVDNASQKEIFMKMAEIQAGLGFGAKKYQVVFVFETQEALRKFVNSGWEIGAQATAAAIDGKRGAAFQGAASLAACRT